MFESALQKYGLNNCSISGQSLIIGVGPDEPLGEPVKSPPEDPQSILFLNAPEQVELISSFLGSELSGHVRHLALGTSHLVAQQQGSLDFRKALATLEGSTLTALETLSLGDMERLFNGHCYYGTLGDILPVFTAAPNLRSLELFGHFSLSASVDHPHIQELSLIVDEIGITGGPPSQNTIDNLLSSRFLHMRSIELWLDDGDEDLGYTLPDAFFSGSRMPMLEVFGFDKLEGRAISKIQRHAEKQGIALHFE